MILIKQLRSRNKISQQKLADSIHVSRSTVAMWEAGASEPDTEKLKLLAEYFNVSVDYLLGRDDSVQKESPAADESGEADLDRELVSLLCQLDSPQEEQRVKDFVRGILAAREAPASPDK